MKGGTDETLRWHCMIGACLHRGCRGSWGSARVIASASVSQMKTEHAFETLMHQNLEHPCNFKSHMNAGIFSYNKAQLTIATSKILSMSAELLKPRDLRYSLPSRYLFSASVLLEFLTAASQQVGQVDVECIQT